MKRLTIILVALVCLCQVLKAQTHYEGRISVGGKAGATLSRMQFNPSVPQRFLPGMMFGGTFRYIEERHFGLILELNVEQRGWKELYEDTDFQYQRRFTYVQLPMLTHIFFGNNRMKGFFNAGPELGYMIAHSTSATRIWRMFSSKPVLLSRGGEAGRKSATVSKLQVCQNRQSNPNKEVSWLHSRGIMYT